MTVLRVAAVQLGPSSTDLANNRAEVAQRVTEAAERGADLVVLPELALTPYFGALPAGQRREWACALGTGDAAFLARLGAQAGVHLVGPFFERDARTGLRYNSALLADPGGDTVPAVDRHKRLLPTDRKLHLPVGERPRCDEPAHFAPGESLGLHRLGSVALGCLICYDRRFPECWRELRALGADIVAVSVAGCGDDPDGYFLAELRTHARENGVAVVAANKVGPEMLDGEPTENPGECYVIDAAGLIIAVRSAADGPGVLVADVDLDGIARARHFHQAFEHRRLDLFAGPTVCDPARTDAGYCR